MTDLNEQNDIDRDPDLVRLLVGQHASIVPRVEHRDALRSEFLQTFDAAQVSKLSTGIFYRIFAKGSFLMNHRFSRYGVGLTASLLLVWFLWVSPPAHALSDVVERIRNAKRLRYSVSVVKEGAPEVVYTEWYESPALYRSDQVVKTTMELPNGQKQISTANISIIRDLKDGREIHLNHDLKTAVVYKHQAPPTVIAGSLEHFWKLYHSASEAGSDAKQLPDTTIQDTAAVGYEFPTFSSLEPGSVQFGAIRIWADRDMNTLLRIEAELFQFGTNTVMSKFEIDPEVASDFFSLEVPEGFTEINGGKLQSPLTFNHFDLINDLRSFIELNDGMFPDSINPDAYSALLGRIPPKEINAGEVGPKSTRVVVQRGISFVNNLPPSSQPYYAGAGVKQGTPDRPIFWYKPFHSEKFCVIFADFTVAEVDEAPKIEGAEPVQKAKLE